ncbi:hypothetical protein JZM31_06675 [Acinetobacter pittii]|nr:hypothetical protein [Acinetobacter pittii]
MIDFNKEREIGSEGMKKFKLTWLERVCDEDGYTLYHENKSQIIEAENEDKACEIWEEENEYNENQNGLDDCIEVVEHPLFEKYLIISMPDGLDYGVPIEVIARNRAEHYADEFNGDITLSLIEDTLPLFASDSYEIRDWASNNMNFSDVKEQTIVLKKKVAKEDFEDAWCNGEWKVV